MVLTMKNNFVILLKYFILILFCYIITDGFEHWTKQKYFVFALFIIAGSVMLYYFYKKKEQIACSKIKSYFMTLAKYLMLMIFCTFVIEGFEDWTFNQYVDFFIVVLIGSSMIYYFNKKDRFL